MLPDADRSGRYLLLACGLGVAVLLTVIAEHIEHAQRPGLSALKPAATTGNTDKK